MSTHESENHLIAQAVKWSAKSTEAIHSAGGAPTLVLKMFPDELLGVLVRNNLGLVYTGATMEGKS